MEGKNTVAQQPGPARRRTARRRLLAAAAVALALGPSWAGAAAEAAPRRLKAVIINAAPMGWLDAEGRPAGLSADLVRRLALDSGLAIDTVLVPYPRAMAMVAAGDADLMISLINAELERGARQLGVLFAAEIVVIGRAGLTLTSLADLRGKTVGHLRRAEYSPALMNEPGILHYETSSSEHTMTMLSMGRIDAALGIRMALYHTMRRLQVLPEQLGPMLSLGKRNVVVYYSDKRYEPETAARLKRGIEAMRQGGAVAVLVAKYEPGPARPQR